MITSDRASFHRFISNHWILNCQKRIKIESKRKEVFCQIIQELLNCFFPLRWLHHVRSKSTEKENWKSLPEFFFSLFSILFVFEACRRRLFICLRCQSKILWRLAKLPIQKINADYSFKPYKGGTWGKSAKKTILTHSLISQPIFSDGTLNKSGRTTVYSDRFSRCQIRQMCFIHSCLFKFLELLWISWTFFIMSLCHNQPEGQLQLGRRV